MKHSSAKRVIQVSSLCTLFFMGYVCAATCPTDIKRNKEGYWYSDQKPGWKSKKRTPENITLDTKDFGGVVYSPKHKRLACVYKTSDKKWFALVSNKHPNIVIDKEAKDDSGKGPAWRYSKKYHDYACGTPFTTKLSKCVFELKEEKSSHHQHHKKHKKVVSHLKPHHSKHTKKLKTATKPKKSVPGEQKASLKQLAPPKATMTRNKIATLLH